MFKFIRKKKKLPTFNVDDNNNDKILLNNKIQLFKKQKITESQISWRYYLEQKKNEEIKKKKEDDIKEIRRVHGIITNNKNTNNKNKNKIYPL